MIYGPPLGAIRIFCLIADRKGITPYNITVECFSPKTLNEWLLWMKEEKSSSTSTCNNRMAAIKSLLKYMGGESPDYAHLYNQAHEYVKYAALRISLLG